MGFFDKFDKFLEKAENFVDEAMKTSYDKETLITLCKNDRRILFDAMLSKAKSLSGETDDFFWNMERIGTCTIKEVSEGIFLVTINGVIDGVDKFGGLTDTFTYTKSIYIDKYGDLNTTKGQSSVLLKKRA